MRIETLEKKVYSFEDLENNIELKSRVLDKWRTYVEYHFIDEIYESKNAYVESLPEIEYDLTGLRLRTWLINNYLPDIEQHKTIYACRMNDGKLFKNCVGLNSIKRRSKINIEISCPFTGMCYDHDFLEPILNFIKRPSEFTTWRDLMIHDKILKSVLEKEQDWQDSEEYIMDCLESNGFEFNEDGSIY